MLDTEVINLFMLIAGLSALVFNRLFGCVGFYLHFPRPNDLSEARSLETIIGSISIAGGVGLSLFGLCGILLPRFSLAAELGGALKPALVLLGVGSLMNAGIFLGRLRTTAVSLTKEQFQDLLYRKITEPAINRLVLIAGGILLTLGLGMITLGLH